MLATAPPCLLLSRWLGCASLSFKVQATSTSMGSARGHTMCQALSRRAHRPMGGDRGCRGVGVARVNETAQDAPSPQPTQQGQLGKPQP